jgi:selenocysteine lyase/cysteine desulfurase
MSPKSSTGVPPDRGAFDLPRDVAYLNAAAYGPLTKVTLKVGQQALAARSAPWRLDKAAAARDIERARTAAAALINASAKNLAIVSSVSHAVAIAAAELPTAPGARVLRLEGEHPSSVLPWARLVARGCAQEIVPEPSDGDWTSATLRAIERPGAGPLAVAALAPYRWTDGACVDLDRIAPAVRRAGGALFIDATHAVGVSPVDVERNRPDFLAFPLFKWVMGPYGMACLYADPSRQGGEPLDRSAGNCLLSEDLVWRSAAEGARRYDRGERDDFVAAALAATALEQILGWDIACIATQVAPLGAMLAEITASVGAHVLSADRRAPHIVGIRFDDRISAVDVMRRLAAQGVFVSERLGVLRVSPHVYNDRSDVERFAAALPRAMHP